MTDSDKIALARFLGTVAMLGWFLYGGAFRRRRNNQLLEAELEVTRNRMLYLAAMFDKYDIEIDEFDLIALRNM